MTIQLEKFNKLKQADKLFLTAAEIAPVLECDPHLLRLQAKHEPELLGFPSTTLGNRTKFPRLPFIQFVETLCCCHSKSEEEVRP